MENKTKGLFGFAYFSLSTSISTKFMEIAYDKSINIFQLVAYYITILDGTHKIKA